MDLAFTKRPSRFGHRFFLVIVDEFSDLKSVIPVFRKSDVFAEFEKWHADMAAVTGLRLRFITTDNGTEFVNKKFKLFCLRNRVNHRKTVPHHSFQNGIAERAIRTIRLIGTKILQSSNVRLEYWSDVIAFAVFIHNRRPSLKLNLRKPIEVFAPHLIESRFLFKFGSPVYFINPPDSKSDSNKRPGVFLGYPAFVKGYFVFDLIERKSKIIHDLVAVNNFLPKDSDSDCLLSVYNNLNLFKCNCKFNDLYAVNLGDKSITTKSASHPICNAEQLNCNPSHSTIPSAHQTQQTPTAAASSEPLRRTADSDSNVNNVNNSFQNRQPPPNRPFTRSYARQLQLQPNASNYLTPSTNPHVQSGTDPPAQSSDPTGRLAFENNFHVFSEQQPSNEQLNIDEVNERLLPIDLETDRDPEWQSAAFEQISALINSGTVEYVQRPKDKQILSSMLVCTEKMDENGNFVKKKVRCVAKGCQQAKSPDRRTYAPVAGKPIIRLALAVANQKKWLVDHVDIKDAYLNSPIDEEIYVLPPKIFRKPGMVWKLHRAIYGLKQSACLWFDCLSSKLKDLGLKQSLREPCLFFSDDLLIVLYVDDLVVCGESRIKIDKFKRELAGEFELRDLGEVRHLLGIKIEYDRERGSMNLSQPAKVNEILSDYQDRYKRRAVNCPLPKSEQKELKDKANSNNWLNDEQASEYRSLLMRLNYLASTIRPDLQIYVNVLSRCSRPTVELLRELLKVLNYLDKTAEMKLEFKRQSDLNFEIYSDASYFRSTGESTIGLAHMINGTVFDWVCYKDGHVNTSTNQAEFTSIYQASKSAVYYSDIFRDLGVPLNGPVRVKNDNSGAVRCATRGVKFDSRDFGATELKTIERTRDGVIRVELVNERENVADLLTKFLDPARFRTCLNGIGLF